jgi:predicted nucleic acid-binding protein
VSTLLLDTGPLVAYLCAGERDHEWAKAQFASLTGPLVTCEPVWTEAAFLVAERGASADLLWPFLRSGDVQFAFSLETEFEFVAALMRRYANLPMALADACLVRMTELHRDCHVLTLDAHFRVYRRHGRQVIPVICPR